MTYLETRQLSWEHSLLTEELYEFHTRCDGEVDQDIEDAIDDGVWDGADDAYLATLGDRLDNQDDDLEDFAY